MSAPGVFTEAMYVRHTGKPEWGVGKVLRVRGDRVDVYFAGDLEVRTVKTDTAALVRAEDVTSHALLDSLPPFEEDERGVLRPPPPPKGKTRLTISQAKQKFLDHFPLGFNDPTYWGDDCVGERAYKWRRHELFEELLGRGQGERLLADGALDELRSRVSRAACEDFNLLDFRYEAPIFLDALAPSDAARNYFESLFALLREPEPNEIRFTAYADAASRLPHKKVAVSTWPIVTLLPYVAQPDKHMFFRVTPTRELAAILTFDLRYEPKPGWPTYSRLLQLASLLLQELAPLGAKDFMDVQSFMYVVTGYRGVEQGAPQAGD